MQARHHRGVRELRVEGVRGHHAAGHLAGQDREQVRSAADLAADVRRHHAAAALAEAADLQPGDKRDVDQEQHQQAVLAAGGPAQEAVAEGAGRDQRAEPEAVRGHDGDAQVLAEQDAGAAGHAAALLQP